jgi:ELWxxDGT repeat protein
MASMLFAANDGGSDYELWITDGTALRTHEVADINPGSAGSFPSNYKSGGSGGQLPFAVLNGYAYFSATNANGTQLWRSDGTNAGTTQVTNFAGGAGPQKHRHGQWPDLLQR